MLSIFVDLRTKIKIHKIIKKIVKREACKVYKEFDFKDNLARLVCTLIDECCRWIDLIGFHKLANKCFPSVHYNIMTSNSEKSIDSLSRDT